MAGCIIQGIYRSRALTLSSYIFHSIVVYLLQIMSDTVIRLLYHDYFLTEKVVRL